jgi:hypothetical protein
MTTHVPEATRYFVRATFTGPPTVMRRIGVVDEAWAGSEWVPTKSIIDWMFGDDDNVDEVGPAVARATAPAAFEPPVPDGEAQAVAPAAFLTPQNPKPIRYFLDSMWAPPPMVMRRIGNRDEVWVGGKWQPTKAIIDWMYGHNDWLDEVTDNEARAVAPDAFPTTMVPRRLPTGNLVVPMRAEADDGTIGDAVVEIGPDHPDFAAWDAYLLKAQAVAPAAVQTGPVCPKCGLPRRCASPRSVRPPSSTSWRCRATSPRRSG